MSNRGPKLSYLVFADDLILFAEACLDQRDIIQDIMHEFCQSSSQRVSIDKTCIFFSKYLHLNVKPQIASKAGLQVTNVLSKYLGVPILHKRVTGDSYRYVLDRVDQCLSS